MTKINLAKYFPKIYDGILEITHLTAVEDELLEHFSAIISEAQANQFILTANGRGLDYFEQGLEVDFSELALEGRREALLALYKSRPVYTYKYLLNYLQSALEGYAWTITLNLNDLSLNIDVNTDDNILGSVLLTVIKLIPANILLDAEQIYPPVDVEGDGYVGGAANFGSVYTLSVKVPDFSPTDKSSLYFLEPEIEIFNTDIWA